MTDDQLDDISDKDLEAMAEDFMWNSKEPAWGFEKIGGNAGEAKDE